MTSNRNLTHRGDIFFSGQATFHPVAPASNPDDILNVFSEFNWSVINCICIAKKNKVEGKHKETGNDPIDKNGF